MYYYLSMETKEENFIGTVVRLKTNFLNKCKEIDNCVPTKSWRPYIVIPLNYNGTKQLFAVPLYSNLNAKVSSEFRTIFSPRLKTGTEIFTHHACAYSCMLPITREHIFAKAYDKGLIPIADADKVSELKNIKSRQVESVPPKAQNYLLAMQTMCAPQKQPDGKYVNVGIEIFDNKEFKKSYGKVSKALFSHFIIEVSENLENIINKAQRYLDDHYLAYRRGKKSKMPVIHTEINKLYDFAVNGNKKIYSQKEELMTKYKLTEKQYGMAEKIFERDFKNKGKISLETLIRSNIKFSPDGIFDKDVKGKILADGRRNITATKPKTQEKTVTKPAVQKQKTIPKKRPVNYK
jgi:hypothetical protein